MYSHKDYYLSLKQRSGLGLELTPQKRKKKKLVYAVNSISLSVSSLAWYECVKIIKTSKEVKNKFLNTKDSFKTGKKITTARRIFFSHLTFLVAVKKL